MVEPRKIPIYKLEFEQDFIKKYQQGAKEILTSISLSEGEKVKQFENLFAQYVGAKHGIAVCNGTAAIEVALRALNVEGKEVIIPTNTFFATAVAGICAGANITLVDIEDNTFSIDPEDLKKKISSDTGAVVIVHIGGMISERIEEIMDICKEYNVPLVEDAAHAHGSTYKNYSAGTIGTIGCFSFFPTKVMTTGEGGMITTNDESLDNLMRSIKNFGRDLEKPIFTVRSGLNYKINEFTALMGILDLERVSSRVEKRTQLAKIYQEELNNTSYIPIKYIEGINSYYKQIVKIQLRQDELHKYCKEKGVSLTGEVYKFPVHEQPLFKGEYNNDDYPVSNHFSKNHICPPLYPELEPDDIYYVCEVLKSAEKEIE